MRINRQTLLKITDETVAQRTRKDRGILSIYLCGSLLEDEFLLGGTTDIDLAFIHSDAVPAEREIVHLSDDIHLDIAHYDQRDFRQPRKLRMHPWLGPAIFSCKVLYDPQHFMDFTQASVRGQFDRPDYTFQRSREQFEHARQIWASFHETVPKEPGAKEIYQYLKAVEHVANAAASLYGPPLTERRFLVRYRQRLEAAGQTGLYGGYLGLLGAPQLEAGSLQIWIVAWRTCLQALRGGELPPRLDPNRLAYYQHAFEAYLDGDQPVAPLWALLRTWTLAALQLSPEAEELAAWKKACTQLGLLGAGFGERLEALDTYLDAVDDLTEKWARANGVGI
jgi:predicted nucleotidyltransferase